LGHVGKGISPRPKEGKAPRKLRAKKSRTRGKKGKTSARGNGFLEKDYSMKKGGGGLVKKKPDRIDSLGAQRGDVVTGERPNVQVA